LAVNPYKTAEEAWGQQGSSYPLVLVGKPYGRTKPTQQ
jgi:hypothetical protein